MSPRWQHRLAHWLYDPGDCLFCRQDKDARRARRRRAKKLAQMVKGP